MAVGAALGAIPGCAVHIQLPINNKVGQINLKFFAAPRAFGEYIAVVTVLDGNAMVSLGLDVKHNFQPFKRYFLLFDS